MKVSCSIVKHLNLSPSTSEISLSAQFHLMRYCQTICNFIPSLCSIWPVLILIIQYFSGWLSQFSPISVDIDMNWVHFHHYPMLKCSLFNPSGLGVVVAPSLCVQSTLSMSDIACIFFSRLIYLNLLSPSELELPTPITPLFPFLHPAKVSVENILRWIWPWHFPCTEWDRKQILKIPIFSHLLGP